MSAIGTRPSVTLFRPEVTERRKIEARPVLEISQPAGSWWATAVVALLFVIGLAAAMVIQSPRGVTLPGALVSSARPIEIIAPRAGTVTGLFVNEGAQVRLGERLVKVDVEQPTDTLLSPDGGSTGALLRLRSATIRQAPIAESGHRRELQGLLGARRSLSDQVASLDRQIQTAGRIVALGERSLAAVQPLIDRGFISRAELDRRQQAVLGQQLQVASLAQQRSALLGQISELDGRINQARLATEVRQVELESNLADLDSRIAQAAAGRPYLIQAMTDGHVTSVRTRIGQMVQPGALLFVLIPAQPDFEIEVHASPANIAEIRPGQVVAIEYDAYPASTFGTERGTVRSVSRAPVRLNPNDPPVYLVRVQIRRGAMAPLRGSPPRMNGMTARVKIIGRQQSLLATVSRALIG